MQQKVISKHVLRNIILSYGLILVIIIGIWTIAIRGMSRIIVSQNDTIYGNMLEVLSMNVDKNLAIAERSALSIALSDDLKRLLSDWNGEKGDILQIRAVKNDMANVMAKQSAFDDCMIYMKNKDYIIAYNTTGSTTTYYRTYIEEMNISYEDWLAWMEEIRVNGYYMMQTADKEYLYYAYQMPINAIKKEAVLFLKMSTSGIESNLEPLQSSHDLQFEIISANDTAIISADYDTSDYQMIEVVSRESGWIYRGYVQNGSFDKYLRQCTGFMIWGILGITGICAIVLIVSLRTTYAPLNSIIKNLEETLAHPKERINEYQFISSSLETLIRRQKEDQQTLEDQREKLKTVYLQYLLSGKYRYEPNCEKELGLFFLDFLQGSFCGAAIILESDCSEGQIDHIFQERKIVLDDISLKGTKIDRKENRIGYFLNLSLRSYEEACSLMMRLLEQLEIQGFICHAFLSAVHSGCEEAYRANDEIGELIRADGNDSRLITWGGYLREKKQNQLLQNIRDFIAANYSNPDLGVEMVCQSLNKSVSGVNKMLKEQGCEGIPFYINETRIQEAKRIFKESKGTLSVKEVMVRVGYENQNTFIRVFKKYEGITPGEYAKNIQNAQ